MQTAITAFDPMADQFGPKIRQAKRNELHNLWLTLEGFAHHNSKPEIEEFKGCLSSLERVIFDLLAPISSQDQHEIQSILERSDRSESDEDRILSLIERRGANFSFFFQHATGSSWIPVLGKWGYFDNPPNVEPINDGRVNFPFWWPILYLKRVSISDPRLVVETILNFSDTDNPRILHEIAEIALIVEPVEQSLRLKDWVLKYLQAPFHLGASDPMGKLVNRWAEASSESIAAALDLVRPAISFMADPQSQSKQARFRANPKDMTTDLKPRPPFSEWEYREFLEKGVRPLSEKEPYKTARILIDATATMVRLAFHQDQLEKACSNDLSMIWCPARELPQPKL